MSRKKPRKKGAVARKSCQGDVAGSKNSRDGEMRGKSETSGADRDTATNGVPDTTVTTTATTTSTAAVAAVAAVAISTGTDSVTPIDVFARLTYPVVRSFPKDESADDSAEEEEAGYSVELKFSPRFCFAANLCIVCMDRSKMVCDHCEMVSYCSAKHRAQGSAKHRDLCDALAEIRRRAAGDLSGPLSADQYRIYRARTVELLSLEVARPLELWEREIVLYPRVCRLCYDLSNELTCCPSCAIESFCKKHENEHRQWCREFEVFRRCLLLQHRHGHVHPVVPNNVEQSPLRLPGSMDRLFLRIYAGSPYYFDMDSYTYATLSHVSTIPLTALYSMQLSCPNWGERSSFTVHVVGAEFQFEGRNLEVWEKLFVHFLPKMRRLALRFVGPELRVPDGLPIELLTKVKPCSVCKHSGRSVDVSFNPRTLYHELIRADRSVEPPDLICLFNAGLYRETAYEGRDTWPETILECCKFRAPIVITSYTGDEIPRDLCRVRSISEIETLFEPRRNPFASVKPDRNFVSDDTAPLIYKNYYLAIIRGK